METKTIYIHIGTHKTGSTALQHTLRLKANELRKEGIIYLPKPQITKPLMTATKIDHEIINKERVELQKKLSGENKNRNSRFVWSWEGFSGDPIKGYSNASWVAENLRSITAGFSVCIIVYLRRQDDFIESLYTQKIHEGESYSFSSFVKNYNASSFNWEQLLEYYADCFGKENIIARRYGKEFLPHKDSLLKDFANVIGSKHLASYPDINTPNRGYSRDALEIARIANPQLNKNERKYLRQILQRTSAKQPFDSYSFWDKEKRKEVIARYFESNATVAREYFNEPSGILFPNSELEKNSQIYQGLSLESAVIILTRALVAEKERTMEAALRVRIKKALLPILNKLPWLKSRLISLSRKLGIT